MENSAHEEWPRALAPARFRGLRLAAVASYSEPRKLSRWRWRTKPFGDSVILHRPFSSSVRPNFRTSGIAASLLLALVGLSGCATDIVEATIETEGWEAADPSGGPAPASATISSQKGP